MMKPLKSRSSQRRGNGFTKSVRTLWIYSMDASASYHAFTNCMHSYDRARNVHASGVTRKQKFEHGIDFFV